MARRRNRGGSRRGGRRQFTLPLAIVAGFTPTVFGVWNRRSNMQAALEYLSLGYTGLAFDGTFHPTLLKFGALPLMAGAAVHWAANKMGINRALRSIPIVRI